MKSPEIAEPQQSEQPEQEVVSPEEAEAVKKEMFMSGRALRVGQTMEEYKAEGEQLWGAKEKRETEEKQTADSVIARKKTERSVRDQSEANNIRSELGIALKPLRGVASETVSNKAEILSHREHEESPSLARLKEVFDSIMARASRQGIKDGQRALYEEMVRAGDKAKIAEVILDESTREKRTADYPADKESLDAWEYAEKSKDVPSKVENDWNYRGLFPSGEVKTETRGSLNIKVTPGVVRELDELIKRGVFKGNYKFGDPKTGASPLSRHDAITLYFLEQPSEDALKAFGDIAQRNFRGDNLLGKKISEGFYMSEVGSVSGTHARELLAQIKSGDEELGKAFEHFLTSVDKTTGKRRVAMSEAQFYAAKETLKLYGYDISYDADKGFAVEQSDMGDKQKKWEERRKEIEQITDPTGRGIDEGVKETVTAFNVNEIPTTQSCEGHEEVEGGHRPWPWVEVGAPDEPEERFVGETEAFTKTAQEKGVPLDELKKGHPEEIYWELRKKISQNPLTLEYQTWEEKNKRLHDKITALLTEFYAERKVDAGMQLRAEATDGGSFEISSETQIVNRFLNNELTSEEKKGLLEMLPKRQKEMQDFSGFLKKRYVENSEEERKSGKEKRESRVYNIPADGKLLEEYAQEHFRKFVEGGSETFKETWTENDLDHFRQYMIVSLRTRVKEHSDEEEYHDNMKSIWRTSEERHIFQMLMETKSGSSMSPGELDEQPFSKVAEEYLGINVEEIDKDYLTHFSRQ